MSTDEEKTASGRRVFLRTTLAAGLSMAAVFVAHKGITAFAAPVEETQQQDGSQGYHLTEHINAYYQSAAL
jgi:hypothetical protein